MTVIMTDLLHHYINTKQGMNYCLLFAVINAYQARSLCSHKLYLDDSRHPQVGGNLTAAFIVVEEAAAGSTSLKVIDKATSCLQAAQQENLLLHR